MGQSAIYYRNVIARAHQVWSCPAKAGHPVTPGESGGYWIARFRACEIILPHPEERRFLAARLEGWPPARPCLLPSFETAAQEGGLLRMRASISSHALSRAMTFR